MPLDTNKLNENIREGLFQSPDLACTICLQMANDGHQLQPMLTMMMRIYLTRNHQLLEMIDHQNIGNMF